MDKKEESQVNYTATPKSLRALFGLLLGGKWSDKDTKADIGRDRSLWVFRGLNRNYPLQNSLSRINSSPTNIEAHLLRNFRKYARAEHQSPDTFWYWISLAQHHGLPTRLLDWTFSPLLALHFATANTRHYREDGCIWAVHRERVHRYLPGEWGKELNENNLYNFTVELLSKYTGEETGKFNAQTSLEKFEKFRGRGKKDFLLFFEPPSIDPRIVNQFALFSIMSNPAHLLDKWLEGHQKVYKKIRIPAHLKLAIRDRLDTANITERMLFPGFGGIAGWLKRHYSDLKKFRPANVLDR